MFLGDRFVFVENPKTASTSIQNALRAAELGLTIGNKHDNYNRYHEQKYARRYRAVTVRNPWDRMVSGWFHNIGSARKTEKPYDDFATWLTGEAWQIAPGFDFKRTPQCFWTWKTNVLLRFETLEEDISRFGALIGADLTLPHDNATRDRLPYQHYYTEKTKRIIEDRFWPDIQKYGYEFG